MQRLFQPIDIASLIVFRFAFGAIMTWEALRYLVPRLPDHVSWARQFYIEPRFLFHYYGFAWVRPWPDDGMVYHFWAWAIAAVLVAVGACYRLSAVLLFVLVTHTFLLDQTRYLNHMYLICLICFLLIFLPLNRSKSVDAWLRPAIRSNLVPAWTLWLLRFQMAIVYVFSGIARANADWMRGEPMRSWLRARAAEGSPFQSILLSEWAPYFFSFGGICFDLLIVPLLLWRRTRPMAFCAAGFFHLSNAYLFHIGVFPWLGIAATTLFLEPSWPRRLCAICRLPAFPRDRPQDGAAPPRAELARPRAAVARPFSTRSTTVVALAIYFAVQVLLPLRHLLYPGSVNWTMEGHHFAWRMKLDDRRAAVRMEVKNPSTGQRRNVDLNRFLTGRQQHVMSTRPDMLVNFAHHLARNYRDEFAAQPEVYATVALSLNGRPMKPLIDPRVDLAGCEVSLKPADWVVRDGP